MEDIQKTFGLGERLLFPNRAVRADCNPTRNVPSEDELEISFFEDGIIEDLLAPFGHMEESGSFVYRCVRVYGVSESILFV